MDYGILGTELTTDPASLGYAGKTDQQAADLLNSLATGRTQIRTALDGAEVYEALVVSEFLALTDAQRAEVWNVVHLGANIAVAPGSKARARMITLFGAGSATIAALAARLTSAISRAKELGLSAVTPDDVAIALGKRPLVQQEAAHG